MSVQYLDWDSEFFGFRIGRADISSYQELIRLCTMEAELGKQYDLIYVYCQPMVRFEHSNVYLVDEKTIYTKRIESQPICANVCMYQDSLPNEDLYRLALISGEFSRFRNDIHFPKGSYERLYHRWIEQSVLGNMANKVFVYQQEQRICGMLTAKWDVNTANYGLLAVDTQMQGKGIGTKMMQTLENYLAHETSAITLSLSTQKNNQNACRLYEKLGFSVNGVTSVYHWWL